MHELSIALSILDLVGEEAEHRTGRLDLLQFVESIGGSLIQSRATNADIFERVPFEDSISTFRISTNLLGGGFVEAIANSTLLGIRDRQPTAIRGTALEVAVLEANNAPRIGRVLMAYGRDAADVAISNAFGAAVLTHFKVHCDEE